jgi:ribose transport system substrate-binding protein
MMPYLALQMLYDWRNHRIKAGIDWQKIQVNPLPPNVDTGSFVITRENVGHFRREQGRASRPGEPRQGQL